MSTKSAIPKSIVKEFTFMRVFDAPREIVFKAWTDPAHFAKWWGPKGFTNPVCKLDLKVNGPIEVVMRGPNGLEYPMGGHFVEINPPERLVFIASAMQDEHGECHHETHNTVTFVNEKGKTKMTLVAKVTKSTMKAAGALAGMEVGWTQSLERLSALVSKH